MQISRNSHSRGKISRRKNECIPSLDTLHYGLRRKVSQSNYKSIYPRLKIIDKSRVNTITILQNQFNEEYIHDEVLNMREENRKIEEENERLRANIRRGNKLNDMFERRREKEQLENMEFEKLVQLKLLLESEDLEEEYAKCQNRLLEAQQTHKTVKNSIKNDNNSSQIAFVNLLTELGHDSAEMKANNETKIDNLNNHLASIKLKTRKLKQVLKAKAEQSVTLAQQILTQKKKLPAKFDSNVSVSDSGVMSLQVRNKSIDEIECEIAKVKEETKMFQENMQNQIDSYVLAKIILYREIDDLKDKVEEKQCKKNGAVVIW